MKKILALVCFSFIIVISSQVLASDHSVFKPKKNLISNSNFSNYNWIPYINKVDKDLKSNWFAPKYGNNVEIVFKITKQGTYKNLRITNPSKSIEDNQAAIDAVMYSSPFKPIPGSAKELMIKYNFPSRNVSTTIKHEPIQVVVLN